jgi:anti-sigma factor RsiW
MPNSYEVERMKKKQVCRMNDETLIDLVEGKGSRETAQHIKECRACQRRVKQFQRLVDMLRYPFIQPSAEVLKRVKALGRSSRKGITARLVSTSFAMAGVRRPAPASFQSLYETRGVKVRLMYSFQGDHWDVRGRVMPPLPASVYAGDSRKATALDEEGRFAYKVKDLAQAGLRLVVGKMEIKVPPPSLRKPTRKKKGK